MAPMLFSGTHPRTLDEKKRLAFPKRIRETLKDVEQLFVAQGLDNCLWVYTPEGLEQLAAKLDEVPATDAEARVFRRLFFAQMEPVEPDASGRILIPDRLVQFAGLRHDVVLIGVRDHLEVWDSGRWQAYLAKHGPQFDAVAESAFRK